MKINMEAIQGKIISFSNIITSNKYVRAITNGLSSTLAIIMVGAIAALLKGIPVPAYTAFLGSSGLGGMLSIVIDFTTNIISIYMVFMIAYQLAHELHTEGIMAGMLALLNFLVLIPLGTYNSKGSVISFISFDWLGPQGIFVAIIVGLLTAKIYAYIVKKNIVIKMPEGVPAAISDSFTSLIPGFIITIFFVIVDVIIKVTPYDSFPNLVYSILQQPLMGLGGNLGSMVIVGLISGILWFFGIHGAMVLTPLYMTVFMPLDLQNLSAYGAGKAMPHIFTLEFGAVYGSIGGSGCTLGLVIMMIIFAKSKRYRTLGKLSLLPGIFMINEPIIFGTPIVFNPILAIPFIFTPIINQFIAYVITLIGLVPRVAGVQIDMGVPPFIQGIIQGSWKIGVLQIVLIILDAIIYLPFLKMADKKAVQEEKAGTAGETAIA